MYWLSVIQKHILLKLRNTCNWGIFLMENEALNNNIVDGVVEVEHEIEDLTI
jgi:hypothetical protein